MKRLIAVNLVLLLAMHWPLSAKEVLTLPVSASAQWPVILLDLGQQAALAEDSATRIAMGEISSKERVSSVEVADQEINVFHPGFADWSVAFRFRLKDPPQTKAYRFWARWRQGGEPDVCIQTFEIWAGPDAEHLRNSGTFALKPKGWQAAWISGESLVALQAEDRVIEIRNSGAGQDVKVFDAFLLAPPWAALPVVASVDKPLLLLELGQSPLLAGLEKNPAVQVFIGSASSGIGAESLLTDKDEVQVFHQGFGNWQAHFRFELEPSIPAGRYRFFARYKSGGEVSQVTQRFTIKAGSNPERLATRVELTTTNKTPWEYQWLQAEDSLTLLPGDRWLEINNSGQADGAKVFDAFLLQTEAPAADWMNVEQAQLRNRFLALVKQNPAAKRHLYVLDGPGKNGDTLFTGLAAREAEKHYENLSVAYLIGEPAETMAQQLNINSLPAAMISDANDTLLGMVSQPNSAAEVSRFLADPGKGGNMPVPPAVKTNAPTPVKQGKPAAWLVGGLQDGLAGVSVAGLDSESVLRPNPGQPYVSLQMQGGEMKTWQPAQTQNDGSVDILKAVPHAYGWSRGTGYALLYLHADQAQSIDLHLQQSGIKTQAWLDGNSLALDQDPKPPTVFLSAGERLKTVLKGLTPEGLLATALAEQQEPPRLAKLELAPGWHSLLLKLIMQHDAGQRFFFKALFTDEQGQAIEDMQTQLSDPTAELSLQQIAAQLRPLMFIDAPANLPHPGDAIKLRLDLRWHPILEQPRLPIPLPRFKSRLQLRLVDYGGKQISQREITDLFPGQVEVDFGPIEAPGYYAVYASLFTEDGHLIMHYPADGFSVVRGSAEQKLRLQRKKLWDNDYYALADGDKSFSRAGDYFVWLQRMGIFNSYGGYPGFDQQYRSQWQQARQLGLQLFADSAGDSHWLNDKPEQGARFIDAAASFTRYFKASNEIDIRYEAEWQNLRDPKHWVERVKREYELVHQARQDGHYVGGSLVRPGEGEWFKQALQLGLDRYQDAWDVHAYPQKSPRFGDPLGNGALEDERGVLEAYASLGKKNSLPFWLGETGVKAMHGLTGRRWQAEQTAKMIAWVNSRNDYLGLAFCIAHEYDQAYGRLWDYSMGHKPGEAALYTASALIDGLPYQAVYTGDAAIQAGKFGTTLMIWRDDDKNTVWPLRLDPEQAWLVIDVVGSVHPLTLDASGHAGIAISASPVYVVTKAEYEKLTRF